MASRYLLLYLDIDLDMRYLFKSSSVVDGDSVQSSARKDLDS